jgi:hypothetical protein
MLDRPAGPAGHGALTDEEWLELFTASGVFVTPEKLPFEVSDPMRVYRAATYERCRGMSWCNYLDITPAPPREDGGDTDSVPRSYSSVTTVSSAGVNTAAIPSAWATANMV